MPRGVFKGLVRLPALFLALLRHAKATGYAVQHQ